MRFHVIGMPNYPTTKANNWCAFGAKVFKFCKMMTQRGHHVIHYGVEGSDPTCSQHIDILSKEEWEKHFGQHDINREYSPVRFDPAMPYFQISNEKVIYWIKKNLQPKDIICLTMGLAQKPIYDALKDESCVICENGVGYYGCFLDFCAYESYAQMHVIYGQKSSGPNGRAFDAVIPNYFEVEDFPFIENPTKDYVLFLGRMISRKGIEIAVEATRMAGKKLIMAGQGVRLNSKDSKGSVLVTDENQLLTGSHFEYIGYADAEKRAKLIGNAESLIMPTLFVEPFGGVSVEAGLGGIPAICQDFGAPSETILHGLTGYRCRTIEQFAWALKEAPKLDRKRIADITRSRYSLDAVAPRFEEWFEMLLTVKYGRGMYESNPNRKEIKLVESPLKTYMNQGEELPNLVKLESSPDFPPEDSSHLGGYVSGDHGDEATWFPDLWSWLVKNLRIESVLDIGCGEGHSLKYFRDLGCCVCGLEGTSQTDIDILRIDFTKGPWKPISYPGTKPFDLGWMSEFVEHVEERFIHNVIPALQVCKIVLMTHAFPGQQGHHHVNLRTKEYWIGFMAAAGFILDEELTETCRMISLSNKSPYNHFARSGLAFCRISC